MTRKRGYRGASYSRWRAAAGRASRSRPSPALPRSRHGKAMTRPTGLLLALLLALLLVLLAT